VQLGFVEDPPTARPLRSTRRRTAKGAADVDEQNPTRVALRRRRTWRHYELAVDDLGDLPLRDLQELVVDRTALG
jgi:hypothetical protein